MRRFRRPENKLAGVVLSRRRSCRRTILQPRRFVFAAEVRAGRPEVGVCFPRRFAGGREGLACRRTLACRGGSTVATKVGLCFLRRLLPTTVKVQLVAELHLAEKIRVRRGGSARRGGCCRRPRRSSSSRRFVLLRRLLSTTARVWLVAELQLAEEVRVRRGSPARPEGCCRRPRRSSLTQRFLSADV